MSSRKAASSSSSKSTKSTAKAAEIPAPKGPTKQKINQFTWNIDWLAVDTEPDAKRLKTEKKESKPTAVPIVFGSKTKNRSKVYSGTVRNLGYDVVPTLEDLCLQILIENRSNITYLGDAPYWLIKPVLAKCTPSQLFTLEDFNPRLTEDDDELWQWHCEKECREWHRQEDETWRDLFIRAEEERKRKLERITRTIDMKEKSKGPIRKTQLAFTDTVPKPPRNVKKLQEKKISRSPTTASSTSSAVSTPSGAAVAAKKTKGFAMKNALNMMRSMRRQY